MPRPGLRAREMYINIDPVLRVPSLKGKDKHTGDEIASLDAGLNDTDKWFANLSVHRVPWRRVGPTWTHSQGVRFRGSRVGPNVTF